MACMIVVTRRGQQRSLLKIFYPLRVATARSPKAQILAWNGSPSAAGVTAVDVIHARPGPLPTPGADVRPGQADPDSTISSSHSPMRSSSVRSGGFQSRDSPHARNSSGNAAS